MSCPAHERGAFTAARQQKIELLESADGGSVFLDEIGERVPALQAKLLRFLKRRRSSASAGVRVEVRVIAATTRDLDDAVSRDVFGKDLCYRLNVMQVMLPPLRDRLSEVPLLANHCIDVFSREFRKQVRGATPEAMDLLQAYAGGAPCASCATRSNARCC